MKTNIRIIILAAGSSSRLGQPKQLLHFHGQSLITSCVKLAGSVTDPPPIVVTGAFEELIKKELEGSRVELVFNREWQTGMASSIQAGLHTANKNPDLEAVLIAVSDQPFLTAAVLSSLIQLRFTSSKPIIASRYDNGVLGTPVIFKAELFGELRKLTGQEGARKIIDKHPEWADTVDFPLGGTDIDTMEDYKRLMATTMHHTK